MRHTLRRSCAACAKLKHSCDLRSPRCSRCVKRNVVCVYANEPIATGTETGVFRRPPRKEPPRPLTCCYNFGSVDPFDSYPPTRLARRHVQRLIHTFLHKIAFQYYPLDLNVASNPFLVSWWPVALGDPALFHVSLQTACLDEERTAQKGFTKSDVLMVDSVTLLRNKFQNAMLAVQDGTMNSVITLATIEFGKGNHEISRTHIQGAKTLVQLRGGINSVRQTSPLTARMISWVSLLVRGSPQFDTQDDAGIGDGIPPIPEWGLPARNVSSDQAVDLLYEKMVEIEISDEEVANVFTRLRNVFHWAAQRTPFPTTKLHDLTCFVVHRLLAVDETNRPEAETSSPVSECMRYAMTLYMLIVQGPTYYSHAELLGATVTKLRHHINRLHSSSCHACGSLDVWVLAVGLVASSSSPTTCGTADYEWFAKEARQVAALLGIENSADAITRVKTVLWLQVPWGDGVFGRHWDAILNVGEPDVSGLPDQDFCEEPFLQMESDRATLC